MLEQDQNKINTILKSIEDRRLEIVEESNSKRTAIEKENSSKLLMQFILFFVALGLSYFFVKYTALFVGIFIVVANFILGRKVYKPDNISLNAYHRKAMENLLGALYPNITYIGNWSSFKKNVGESLLLTGGISGTDHLSGTTQNGYKYECAEIVETYDERGMFRGLFFKIESPVIFSKTIIIRPKLKYGTPNYLAEYKELFIQDLDPVFASKYSIYAQDIMEAKALLTLDFLQPIVNLSKQHFDIRWSLIGNQAYFAASTKTGLFNTLDIQHDVLQPYVLQSFHENVKLCTSIAEELGQQLGNSSERFKINLEHKQKIKDLQDPYNHLLED